MSHGEVGQVLHQDDWQMRRQRHHSRVRAWIDPHKARSLVGERHPVYDFLFSYYSYRPAWLIRWHPGPGVTLAGDEAVESFPWREYRNTPQGMTVDAAAFPAHRRGVIAWVRSLLTITKTRPAFFGCYGLHEWAMVYRQSPEQIRHQGYALRFPAEEVERIVQATGVCCTHYDAFRFFTEAARPLNRHQPTRKTIPEFEQRGCLHTNMDLYKWAYKLAPFTPSELVADCFELARDIREVDMRASPYDLQALGFPAIAVETPEGRADYERHQRGFAARSEGLRARLSAVCDWLLDGQG